MGSATSNTILPSNSINGIVGNSSYKYFQMYGNFIYAVTVYQSSDKGLKQNFRSIDQPLKKILQIEGLKYDFISQGTDTIKDEKEKEKRLKLEKNKLGFIAQDLEKIVPEAVLHAEEEDRYYIDYSAVIPLLVEAIKELNNEIETLKNSPKEKSTAIEAGTTEQSANLNQNVPNPFSTNTLIEMFVPTTISRATLYLYNMQGLQIKQIAVNERGNTSVTIEGHTLKAGMYFYTLITDGKEVDTKKMILTN
jgi:hypothetical protein